MRFRILKTDKGYLVEVEKKKWYGKKYWKCYITTFGMKTKPWYFSSYDTALENLLFEVKWNTIETSRDYER